MKNINSLSESLSIVSPEDQTVFEFQTATFSVSVTGFQNPSYLWERSLDGGINWIPMNRTTNSIKVVGLLEKNGRQYRVVVTDLTSAEDGTTPSITSAPATLTVETATTEPCPNGPKKSRHIYTLNFGECIGEYKLHYDLNPCDNLSNSPSRIIVNWDDDTYDTGFIGNSFFNNQLNDLGFPNVQPGGTSIMKGHISINKNMPTPVTGKVFIDTPFQDSSAKVVLECPEVCGTELDSGSDSGSDIGSDIGSDSDTPPRDLCFAPNPCPIIAATDYLETPGPGDSRNSIVEGEEFITKIQVPAWFALGGQENEFVNIPLMGLPIDIENIGVADTIVKRLDTVKGLPANVDDIPIPEIDAPFNENHTTRLEIVGLSLKSVDPIEAEDGSFYDMYVGLRSYLDDDLPKEQRNLDNTSKGAMTLHYKTSPGLPYMSGTWSSRFGMKVACIFVPAGSCADFEPTKNVAQDGTVTWNPPLKKPLDPTTGLADPKGLVYRLVRNSIDSGYVQGQNVKILEADAQEVPQGERIDIDKEFDCGNSKFVKDPTSPQIEPEDVGAIRFAADVQADSEPAATGNINVESEQTSPHDSGCKNEECTERVTHGVVGQPNRTMCEGPDCGNDSDSGGGGTTPPPG